MGKWGASQTVKQPTRVYLFPSQRPQQIPTGQSSGPSQATMVWPAEVQLASGTQPEMPA